MHNAFRLNGNSFSDKLDLIHFVEKKFPDLSGFIKDWFGESGKIQVKTSGSTGRPKNIILSRTHMINSARATGDYFGLGQGAKALLCLPTAYIAGKMMLVRALVLGWELDSIDASIGLRIPGKPYDFSAMVPVQLRNSFNNCGQIKTLIVGGGEVQQDLLHQIRKIPTRIFETYGMTETITHIAVRPVNLAAGLNDKKNEFKALPGVCFKTDHRNCLVIEAPRISNEVIITNDLVDLNSETSFNWLGRFDHIINSGGVKFIPETLEHKFSPLIKERFFIGSLPDKVLGQKMIMLVEGSTQGDLQSKLKTFQLKHVKRISKIELPKEIYFVDKFEETLSGKVKRAETIEKLNYLTSI